MIKRKSLLALIGTVILVLSLAVPMMQCAPAAEEVTPPAEQGAIEYGGRLDVGFGAGEGLETLRCDDNWQYADMGCIFWPLVYDQLWILGPPPDHEALPMFASSWEVSEDRRTWIFHLRENATFHDGVPVTAEDVAFTLEYLTSTPVWHFVDTLYESLSVIDANTVEVTMERPAMYPPFYWVPILPKHIFEPYKDDLASYPNEEAIGSGQFKLRELKPGQYIWFEVNEDYWGGRPYLDEIVFKVYGSDDAEYMALKSGELDMIGYNGCTVLAADDFKETENMDIIVSPGTRLSFLAFNLHHETAIRDLDVRKAIMHAIDVDRVIDMVYLGYGRKIDSLIYPESPDYNPNLPQYDYDPSLANRILDDNGYSDTDEDGIRNDPITGENLEFDIIVPSSWVPEVKLCTLMKEDLADVGIGLATKVLDEATYYDYHYTPEGDTHDISLGDLEPGPNGTWVWGICQDPEGEGAGWNTAYYNNPDFDELMKRMLAQTDPGKRREYLYDMQLMIAEDLPYGCLYIADVLDPVRTDEFEGFVSWGGISNWLNSWTYFKVHKK